MEEIESLCVLLTVVGQTFDARAHMDVYFSRMKELTRSGNVSSRMQFMLRGYSSTFSLDFFSDVQDEGVPAM